MEYIAVKLKGFPYYIWFLLSKTSNDQINFIGTDGWGKNGALTSINVRATEIQGTITSDKPQYT